MKREPENTLPQQVAVTKFVYKGLRGVRRVRPVQDSVIDAQIARLVKKFECADAAELLSSVDEYETLDQMKDDLRRAKEIQYAQMEESALQDRLLAQAAEAMELELPMQQLSARADQALQAEEKAYLVQHTTLDAYLAMLKKSREEYKAALLAKECLAFRKAVLIEQVAKVERIAITPQEIAAEYQDIANHRGTDLSVAKKGLTEQTVAHALTVRKVRALLVEHAEIATTTLQN
ncbi:MAG: hypothetical protein R3Y06_07685 [Faecalibacterium sp.]